MASVLVQNNQGELTHEGPFGPVLAVLQEGSGNGKTGNVDGLWILPASLLSALQAGQKLWDVVKTGGDVASCGTCPMRSTASGGTGTCYTHGTVVQKGGYAMGVGLVRHGFPSIKLEEVTDRLVRRKAQAEKTAMKKRRNPNKAYAVRLGVYGDPAMVPEVVQAILAAKTRILGYSHQKGLEPEACMVSADSLSEAKAHWATGRRTARVAPLEDLQKEEILCPATVEGKAIRGKEITCVECGLCDARIAAKSVLFPPHGNGKQLLLRLAVD